MKKWWKKRPRWMKKLQGRGKKEAMTNSSSEGTVVGADDWWVQDVTTDWWVQDVTTDKMRTLEEIVVDCKPKRVFKKPQKSRSIVVKGDSKRVSKKQQQKQRYAADMLVAVDEIVEVVPASDMTERRVTFHASPQTPVVKREPPETPRKVPSIMKHPKTEAENNKKVNATIESFLRTVLESAERAHTTMTPIMLAAMEIFLQKLKIFLQICNHHLQPYLAKAIFHPDNLTHLSHFISSIWNVLALKKSDSVMIISWCNSMTLQDLHVRSTNHHHTPKLPEMEWSFREKHVSKQPSQFWKKFQKSSTHHLSMLLDTLQDFMQDCILVLKPQLLLWLNLLLDSVLIDEQKAVLASYSLFYYTRMAAALDHFTQQMIKITMADIQDEWDNAVSDFSDEQTMVLLAFWIFVVVLWPLSFF